MEGRDCVGETGRAVCEELEEGNGIERELAVIV
jgi:hypothetical protein